MKSHRNPTEHPIKLTLHGAAGRPTIILTHGEARVREPLAEQIQRRSSIKPVLPVQGDSGQL